jgi:NAD(P)-dependent dehydrogenase (short-subunit alcohol dehydrogenase family)
VTGGAKGIGLGIAKDLASQGCRIAIWDIDITALAQATTELQQMGAEVFAQQVSVTSQDDVELAVARLHNTTGRVDILVNNAGIGGDKLIEKMTLDFWQRVVETNLNSQFICAKAVLPHMVDQRFGRIINISSRAWLGNRGQASYSASKGAVIRFALSLFETKNSLTVKISGRSMIIELTRPSPTRLMILLKNKSSTSNVIDLISWCVLDLLTQDSTKLLPKTHPSLK